MAMAGWSSAARRLIPRFPTRTPHAYQRLEAMTPDADTGSVGSYPHAEAIEASSAGPVPGSKRVLPATGHRDKAAELMDSTCARIKLTSADNRRVLHKIDMVILPILLTVYFLQALDKSTLAYASVFGLIEDTNLQGEEYSWLGSIVYVAQLLFQPLVAFLLVKLPVGKFSGVVVLAWGIVLSCMALAHDFTGLLVTRFFLGAMEASIAPAFLAITQMWWRRAEQTNRVTAWYAMNGITNMFGSLLSYGLGHIHSQLKSYQIIFLFCGLLTVAFSFVVFVFLPDSPVEAEFLNEKDRLIAIERLRMNQMGIVSRIWKWDHLYESLSDLKTWFWCALIFSISIPSGGISTFGPLIVQSFGFDSFTAILFNIPFGAVQIIATLGGGLLATRIRMKGPIVILLCIPPIIGCSILMAIDHVNGSKAALLAGYYLISVYPGITPLIYSWATQNTAGDTKKRCTNGFLFIGQSAGNIIGPHLYNTDEAPEYTRGLISNLSLYIVIIILAILATIYLHSLNGKHAAMRRSLGKSVHVLDTSMLSVEDADADNENDDEVNHNDPGVVPPVPETPAASAATAAGEAITVPAAGPDGNGAGGGRGTRGSGIGDKAFDDETDLKNEDFIFVY